MTAPLPTAIDRSRPLNSVVAWPPAVLDTWMRRLQQELGVSGFGAPHLNLRAPFQTPLDTPDLVAALRAALRHQPAFEVRLRGWKRLPGVIFLECEPDPPLLRAHDLLLSVGPSTRAAYDGAEYRPHLTLALGVLAWGADLLWDAVQGRTPPVSAFTVEALSLTRESRGEVQELHTFPLRGADAAAGPFPAGGVGAAPH
ncbi:2'-5' RNA ligase [Deinococcus metalli]|uniref:2'-5' RNA ligase n=1 Tax=Deinococcus metalli TaxID=1141878 RepID=A0A7W8KHE7_9DEIO|nr:2'-5' RNA ligase family protein [Deinococcus metalli]MBB5378152.1 2'-5' RNA ligase [Deinococcus metalli]GHF56411.1 2'-5' RNA ligase [Deinococcus metalli]